MLQRDSWPPNSIVRDFARSRPIHENEAVKKEPRLNNRMRWPDDTYDTSGALKFSNISEVYEISDMTGLMQRRLDEGRYGSTTEGAAGWLDRSAACLAVCRE
jgi:hypothetical protein